MQEVGNQIVASKQEQRHKRGDSEKQGDDLGSSFYGDKLYVTQVNQSFDGQKPFGLEHYSPPKMEKLLVGPRNCRIGKVKLINFADEYAKGK